MAKKNTQQDWAEAKKRCRLNETDIQMAKELGMTPKSLLKNIPTSNQQWKAPVKVWIRDLYEKKFNRVLTMKPALSNDLQREPQKQENHSGDEEDLPF